MVDGGGAARSPFTSFQAGLFHYRVWDMLEQLNETGDSILWPDAPTCANRQRWKKHGMSPPKVLDESGIMPALRQIHF